ncbi:hypothetical protein L596_027636 [Steinernema carpocapsae]|uniref:Uncharacterized protein n=1 Tax=Steinernema carpocapsae TaxID=34508 RepID=A0A4U5LW27_STECR|nr:hypothetical protein L596_027636 [Steinernema carpocapsae]
MIVPDPDEMMEYRIVDDPISDGMNGNEADTFFGSSSVELEPRINVDEEDEDELKPTLDGITVASSDSAVISKLAANYQGYALLRRFEHIAKVCPQLRAEAYIALINYITQNTTDITMYNAVYTELAKLRGGNVDLINKPEPFTLDDQTIPAYNTHWAANVNANGGNKVDNCQSEFKRQKDEGVKESTRRAMSELIKTYTELGRLPEALQLFARGMREYCTSFKHVVEMLVEWMTWSLHAGPTYYYRIEHLLNQAERSISEARESADAKAKTGSGPTPAASGTGAPAVNVKQLIETSHCKITLMSGLHNLITPMKYKEAAEKFINVTFDVFGDDEVISANDVAIYGTICALATFERVELKERILNNMEFRKFMECDTRLVDLVKKFHQSEFRQVLDLLNEMKNELLMNIYIAPHVEKLYNLIRKKAIVLYMKPFTRACIKSMASEFQVDTTTMIDNLAELIHMKSLDARINCKEMVITLNRHNKRAKTHTTTKEACEFVEVMSNAILLRCWMQREGLILGDGPERRRVHREEPDESDSAGYTAMDY